MTPGKKIKYLREEKVLTQQELSDKLVKRYPSGRFTRQVIANWETDRDSPKIPEAKVLVRYFHISLDVLFFDHLSIIRRCGNNLRKVA